MGDVAPICDVVVKIGGSACTKKAVFETLNEEALGASAKQLAALRKESVRMAVIHGAGSFGHQQAREYGVSKGTGGEGAPAYPLDARLLEGAAKTRLSVTTLNKHVITALVAEGLPAMTISPCPFVTTEHKKLVDGQLPAGAATGTEELLKRGFVPVVHGDVVLDEAQGVAVLSGDVWMVELCRSLGARHAVFITDVDGVFTAPPTEPGAELVREILVDPATGELELTGVSMNCASHDVTGGLKAKLESAAAVLLQAPQVKSVFIVRAGSDAAAEALRGKTPEYGTTLRRKQGAVRTLDQAGA
jgi:isopentenyl phosphate kinase